MSPCYSLELCIQMLISFLSPLLLASLLFTAGEGRCTQLCLCEETSETPQRRGLVLRASGLVSMWRCGDVGRMDLQRAWRLCTPSPPLVQCIFFMWLFLSHILYNQWKRKLPSHVWPVWPHGLYGPWNSPGQNTGVGSLSLLQGSSQPRDQTHISYISCIGRWVLYH